MYPFRHFAVAGGLMAYYIDLFETFRYAAGQMAEVLRGKSPAEIPFYEPTKYQLIINTKAGQRIGLELGRRFSPTPTRSSNRTQFAAMHESRSGTFETCRAGLMMSVVRGRPEMAGREAKRRF
jgi:hypothetical protein